MNLPKTILVGIKLPGSPSSSEILLDELKGLAVTAEYDPVAELTQRLNEINPKTFIGSGKVEELKNAVPPSFTRSRNLLMRSYLLGKIVNWEKY